MRYPIRTSGRKRRRGIAMIAVLVVVAILALAAYRFSDLMVAEQQAADMHMRGLQAHASANAGIAYAAAMLAAPTNPSSNSNSQSLLNGNFYDNPQYFQAILLQDGDQARQRARFSIVSPVGPDAATTGGINQSFLYGVTDETGKLNLNALFKLDSSGMILFNILMTLPNMTDAIANSIIFWLDPKATQRASGANNDYYMTLDPPYNPKNGPLDSIEELLFVQGVTPELLFGNDRNRNGILDADEDDGSGTLDMGWSAYLTMYSRESNVDSQGNPRIYVNDPNLQSLQTYLTNAGFDPSVVNFILAYRMYGGTAASGSNGSSGNGSSGSTPASPSGSTAAPPSGSTPVSPSSMTTPQTVNSMTSGANSNNKTVTATTISATGQTASTTVSAKGALTSTVLGSLQGGGGSGGGSGGGQTISSLYALINAQVTIPGSNGEQATTYPSPMSDTGSIKQFLPMILDKLTTKKTATLPARINVNTAPNAVLSALAPSGTPLLDVSTIQTIMATRPQASTTDAPDPIFQTPTWLITEANVPVATLQSTEQYITARSQVFRVQSIGHFDSGGPIARVEAVIDTNAGQRPRIVYYRDLTGLGKGFNLPPPQQP
jgi:type II secretory pathway component PulK